jgi:hypothetical protein
MFPAFLIRAGIDWVRHHESHKGSNPYSRCEEAIKVCQSLWEEQVGKADLFLLEPATIAAYWAEFFHMDDPTPDEDEWRDGLMKRSGQYDSFDDWQEWFKQNYAQVYKEDNVWMGVLMTSWAHTHQYEVLYTEDSWEFRPATPYLPSSEMWRIQPHMKTVAEILRELWQSEANAYAEIGFNIEEVSIPYLGKPECLGFDTKRYAIVWPARAQREKEALELGDIVADIVLPPGDDWYRHLDNVIFANDFLDVTALVNRAKYMFGSRRRLLELTVDNGYDKAKQQASAEGWMVPELEGAAL